MFLDANFFIYVHGDLGKTGVQARALLRRITEGERAYTSALVLDEVMWVLIRNKIAHEKIIEEIYATKNLMVLGVSADAPLKAMIIMREHKLRPRDALHIATMHEHKIKTIVSEDADFATVPGIKKIWV